MKVAEICFLFFIYAFLGWTVEVIYAAVTRGVLENRGFLRGPLCPIYGVGVLVVIGLLWPVKDNLLLLFVCSVLATTTLELVTGFLMKTFFHHMWWDYSKEPLNFHGYICLRFSLIWGLACVFVVAIFHPWLQGMVDKIPQTAMIVSVSVMGAVFVADLIVTLLCLVKLNKTLTALDELSHFMQGGSDLLTKGVAGGTLKLKSAGQKAKEEAAAVQKSVSEKSEQLMNKAARYARRFLNAFPTLRSTKHPVLLDSLRGMLKKKKPASAPGTADAALANEAAASADAVSADAAPSAASGAAMPELLPEERALPASAEDKDAANGASDGPRAV